MDEKKLANDGRVMKAIALMINKNIKIPTIAKTLKMDEVDVRAIADEVKKGATK